MTRSWKIGIAGVVVAIGLPLLVLAQKAETKGETGKAETYKVDPVHSSNWFRIKHMNVTNFYGRFNEMAGTYTFDDANPSGSAFDIQIKTESVDTHNDGRNKHLKSADFFDAEKNPEIAFKSSSVKKLSDKELEVKGDLTLHGGDQAADREDRAHRCGPGHEGRVPQRVRNELRDQAQRVRHEHDDRPAGRRGAVYGQRRRDSAVGELSAIRFQPSARSEGKPRLPAVDHARRRVWLKAAGWPFLEGPTITAEGRRP